MRTVQIGVAIRACGGDVMEPDSGRRDHRLLPSFVFAGFGVKQLVRGITAGALKG